MIGPPQNLREFFYYDQTVEDALLDLAAKELNGKKWILGDSYECKSVCVVQCVCVFKVENLVPDSLFAALAVSQSCLNATLDKTRRVR